MKLRISGLDVRNSLGGGERVHASLKRIYRKVMKNFRHVSNHIILKQALKAMDDRIGENGLVPSFLVFAQTLRLPIISQNLPSEAEEVKILAETQMEMNVTVAERRISTALSKTVSAAADQMYSNDDEGLIYLGNEKDRIRTLTAVTTDGELVAVENQNK